MTPLSEVLRRARTRRVPSSATTNRGFANRAAAVTSPVTNGRSFTTEDEPNGGDVISALKLQTGEIALVNVCLKEVGEVEEATEVEAYLETLEDMVTERTKECERLIPALKKRFKGSSETTYASATRGDAYKDARQRKAFLESWGHFKKGCLGLSKNSVDATRKQFDPGKWVRAANLGSPKGVSWAHKQLQAIQYLGYSF